MLAVGDHKIVATYNGDSNFGLSSSTPTEVTVDPLPPSVESISPSKGPQAGGTPVTIKGQGFQPHLDGDDQRRRRQRSPPSSRRLELTAKTPAGSGAQEVVVSKRKAPSSTGGPKYTYVAPPSVESISPSKGPQAGGTPVTIKGQGFQPTSTVTIGGVGASEVHFVSATELDGQDPPWLRRAGSRRHKRRRQLDRRAQDTPTLPRRASKAGQPQRKDPRPAAPR